MKLPLVLKKRSVYVVLEHAVEDVSDAYVHGVYATREAANNKKQRLEDTSKVPRWLQKNTGYLSVLKLPVKGENQLRTMLTGKYVLVFQDEDK